MAHNDDAFFSPTRQQYDSRMKIVGHRREAPPAMKAEGRLLKACAGFFETVSSLTKPGFIPKGLYRFTSHDAENRHEEECLARSMARLAAERE